MHIKSLRIVFFSYLVVVGVGTLLLSMPFSQYGNVGFIGALFTSTSATCVTGLIVNDTPNDFTFIGQLIILAMIQIGGLGYMSIATIFYLMVKSHIDHNERSIAKESIGHSSMGDVDTYLKKVFIFVFLIEAIGAIVLAIQFSHHSVWYMAIWQGIFHAISAFNNAGFSLFQDNMMGFQHDYIVLSTISILIVFGGLGYFVLIELHQKSLNRHHFFSVHTKIILYGTFVLILSGLLLFVSLEWANPKNFGAMGLMDKLMNGLFLSINFRTAGFNSIDPGTLGEASLFFSTVFMMTGAGAGGTAGGIKITTVVVLIVTAIHTLKGRAKQPYIFKRTIDFEVVNRALAILLTSSFLVIFATVLLMESQKLTFINTLFEVVSAFGTVGVSVGDGGGVVSFSNKFNDFGKIIIIVMMLIGRISIFAFGLILIGREKKKHIQYPKGKILI